MRSSGPVQNILSKRGSAFMDETRTPDEIELDNWKAEAREIFANTYGCVLTGWFNDGGADECAFEAGLTPQEFAYQVGDTYYLTPRPGFRPEVKKAKKAAKKAAKHYKAVTAVLAVEVAVVEAVEAEGQYDNEPDYNELFDAEYEALGRRQTERDDAYHSYQKWLNTPERDDYGRW